MRIRPILLPLLCLLSLPALAGSIYKWTGADGQTHYGETPPLGVQAQAQAQSNIKPGATMTAPAVPAPVAAAKPTEAKPVESKTARAGRCQTAQARIAYLEEKTARRLFVPQADGSEARMTEEEFDVQLNKAKAVVADSCGK